MKNAIIKPVAFVIGSVAVTLLAPAIAYADEANPFSIQQATPTKVAMEGKCGEGKCGEGKCGDKKKKGGAISVLEGKCGEGKCGSLRVRIMMDTDRDGMISKSEYMGWAAVQAGEDFDKMDKNKDGALDSSELEDSESPFNF